MPLGIQGEGQRASRSRPRGSTQPVTLPSPASSSWPATVPLPLGCAAGPRHPTCDGHAQGPTLLRPSSFLRPPSRNQAKGPQCSKPQEPILPHFLRMEAPPQEWACPARQCRAVSSCEEGVRGTGWSRRDPGKTAGMSWPDPQLCQEWSFPTALQGLSRGLPPCSRRLGRGREGHIAEAVEPMQAVPAGFLCRDGHALGKDVSVASVWGL